MPSTPSPGDRRAGRRPRCAIYTRKSSEEGLEQDFNSLAAQREACEAYIRSQKHEGWTCLPDRYDDGGISGGTMERPALQQLLADIKTGKIEVVVVYKVDRLTRALADFAKIVEIFDAKGVAFVSVTQQFNTTSSMGRLTLNVLLSFAQFEREITGERIRDKIAASKKKGMWMGGTPPLGYDARDRKLVVNEREAETVRHIFRRYIELGSVRHLRDDLAATGIVSKAWTSASGRRWGGIPLARGALYAMLRNRIYLGEIVHKEKHYLGEHPPIVARALWDEVQARLSANAAERDSGARCKSPSLLTGLLFDERGHLMTPTHALRRGKRYRYYVSAPLITGPKADAPGGRRLPATDIEQLVINRVRLLLSDDASLLDAISGRVSDAAEQKRLFVRAAELAATWPDLGPTRVRLMLLAMVARIEVHAERVQVHVRTSRVIDILLDQEPGLFAADENGSLVLSVPARLRRTGMETRMIIDGVDPYAPVSQPDPSLVKLIVKAQRLHARLVQGGMSIRSIAGGERLTGSYFTRVLRLSYLAPDITNAILMGRQPPDLTAAKLLRASRLPTDWVAQRTVLGFN
jgi:site-specific DNA recombinase